MLRYVGSIVQFSLAKLTTSLDPVPSPKVPFAPTFYATLGTRREHFELFENIKPTFSTLLTLFSAAMSKYGVLVMGPAGAGKVCAFPNDSYMLFPKEFPDDLLHCLNTTPSTEQAIMFLREPRPCG